MLNVIKASVIGVNKFGPKEEPQKYTQVFVTYGEGTCSEGGTCAGFFFGDSQSVYCVGDVLNIVKTHKGLQELRIS